MRCTHHQRNITMPLDTQEYIPGMSDAAVKAKTGKDWAGWFGALDKAGAANLNHPQIARLLHEKHGVAGWWSQMVTVEYELARGLRVAAAIACPTTRVDRTRDCMISSRLAAV